MLLQPCCSRPPIIIRSISSSSRHHSCSHWCRRPYPHVRRRTATTRSSSSSSSSSRTDAIIPADSCVDGGHNSCGATPDQQQQQPMWLAEVRGRDVAVYSWRPGEPAALLQQHHAQSSRQAAGGQPQASGQGLALLVARQRLLDALLRLYLPPGYPGSVTDDYLSYQLATIPAHITGWLSSSLTTSSLLKAVGISAGPVGATAAAAAIKWIVKDGLGAAGRLLVGGRLGREFDEDPRRWRMAAEALSTVGLALEIATAAFPSQFLLLASLGNLSKAVGKGMGKPVFRVIQTHFAAAGNVGVVAAKEEVWEVSAQLAGYACSVLMLEALQDAGNWQTVVGLWAAVQAAHVTARYLALRQLRFPGLNEKRAKLLVTAYVNQQPLPSMAEGNQLEPLFLTASAMRPAVTFGCGLEEAFGTDVAALQPGLLQSWLQLYSHQDHLLVWRGGKSYVVLKECSTQVTLLKALWQAAWLEAHTPEGDEHSRVASHTLTASLEALDQHFSGFLAAAKLGGWRTEDLVFANVGSARVQLGAAGSI